MTFTVKNKVFVSSIIIVFLIVCVFIVFNYLPRFSIINVPGTKFNVKVQSFYTQTVYNSFVRVILSQDLTPQFDFNKVLYEDGSDIRFFDSSGVELSRYIVRFSKAGKLGEVFVKVPELKPGINQLYLVVGGNAGTQTNIFDELILLDTVAFYPANPNNPVLSTDVGVQGKSNKISFLTAESRYGAAMYPYVLNTKGRMIFYVKRNTPFSDSNLLFQIHVSKDYVSILNLAIKDDNSITVNRMSNSIFPNIIYNGIFYEFDYSYDLDNNKCSLTIYKLNGEKVYEQTFGKETLTGYSGNVLVIYHCNSLYQYTYSGSIWMDFYAYSSIPLFSPLPSVSIEATTTSINFLTGTEYPPLSDVTIRIQALFGDQPIAYEPMTFELFPKAEYGFLGFSQTKTTDSNGIAEFYLKTPCSSGSPYSGTVSILNVSQTVSLNILKGIKVEFTSLPLTSYYDLSGDYDLVIEGLAFDIETGSNLLGFSLTAKTVGPDGRTIETSVETSSTSNVFKVKSKVYNAYNDLNERKVNVTMTFAKTGYYKIVHVKTVLMQPPKVQALLTEPSTTIFPVGTSKIKLTFTGSLASTLTKDMVNVVIVDPEGNKVDVKTLTTYWDSSVPSYSIWYNFEKPGTYKLQITINITPVQYQEISLYVTEKGFTIPWSWLIIGLIAILFLWWVFKK